METPTVGKCVCNIYVLGVVVSVELLKRNDFIFSDIRALSIDSEFEISKLETARDNLLPNDELIIVCELEVEISHQIDAEASEVNVNFKYLLLLGLGWIKLG